MNIRMLNTESMTKYITGLKKLGDEATLTEMGDIAGYYLGTFAPEDTGALKKAYDVIVHKDSVEVTWDGPHAVEYARYQYGGVVYTPNVPVINANTGAFAGWISPVPLFSKTRTHRKLGTPGTMKLSNGHIVEFGYTTAGSSSHWIEKALATDTVNAPMRFQMGRLVYERYMDAIGDKVTGHRYFPKR